MIAGLPLTFAQPLLLLGLLSLPVLWWLLRVMPPRPRRIEFPPTRLLFDIAPKEETPSRTPWWLTVLRLAAAALVPFSEPARDITIMPAGAARVALRQLAPKPYAVDRVDVLPAVERFLKATGDAEIAWLSDGVDTGRGAEFIEGLGKILADRTLTIFQ